MADESCELTAYVNWRCSKCRQARDILDVKDGVDVDYVEYLTTPPSKAELESLMTKLGIDDPRQMMRTGEPDYKELDLANADRDRLLDAITERPILLERPIIVRGDRAVIGRPPERVEELLD